MAKILIITGVTASGKSGLAVEIAKQYNGEIISCDSVQIYKGLDIGSAKITEDEKQGIVHHLIDILPPEVDYSVGQFVLDATRAINDILSRNKLPILVGGTGLYIKALVEGYNFNNAEKNEEFRTSLQLDAEKYGKKYVWDKLNELNSSLAEKVHYNNLKRVIRYLEIATFGETEQNKISPIKEHEYLLIGIAPDREEVYNKINIRVDEMFNMGLVDEVKALVDRGIDLSYNCLNTIGYRETYQYLNGEIDYDKCVELIKQHTRNYCKRQITFMKTIENIKMVDIHEAKKLIKEFLDGNTK